MLELLSMVFSEGYYYAPFVRSAKLSEVVQIMVRSQDQRTLLNLDSRRFCVRPDFTLQHGPYNIVEVTPCPTPEHELELVLRVFARCCIRNSFVCILAMPLLMAAAAATPLALADVIPS